MDENSIYDIPQVSDDYGDNSSHAATHGFSGPSPCFECYGLHFSKDTCCLHCKALHKFRVGIEYDFCDIPSPEEIHEFQRMDKLVTKRQNCENHLFKMRKFVV